MTQGNLAASLDRLVRWSVHDYCLALYFKLIAVKTRNDDCLR